MRYTSHAPKSAAREAGHTAAQKKAPAGYSCKASSGDATTIAPNATADVKIHATTQSSAVIDDPQPLERRKTLASLLDHAGHLLSELTALR